MGQLTDKQTLSSQYGTADKLNTRISIHAKYSVNKQGFGNWITEHYRFPEHASVLELGCGTGDMWKGKSEIIARCGAPIFSTSVNRSGQPVLDSSSAIAAEFAGEVNLIIDDGDKKGALPSTLVMLENGKVKVLRQGSVIV